MSDRTIAIRVPRVRPDEAGPRDAESRAVGNHPAFQQLVHESRRRRAAGERGISVDDALTQAEAEETQEEAPRQPTRTGRVTDAWLRLLEQYVDREYVEGDRAAGSVSEVADLPLEALRGVSKAEAAAIRRALGVKTIREFAEHRLVRAALALSLLATEGAAEASTPATGT